MRSTCRACGGHQLSLILDLGTMPLVNALPATADRQEARFPLRLLMCAECTLVQIGDDVPPEAMFTDYSYFSSYSDTMVQHARHLVERLLLEEQLGAQSRVVEIASNDGYLLQHYRNARVSVLGIEPAANVARIAERERGIPTRVAFFGDALARELVSGGLRADVIHANNVLAHVPDLGGFLKGVARLLADDGLACFEVPHVVEMVDRCEFDTIYHEHLCYFSLTALLPLFAHQGLTIHAVERVAVHGGTLRLFASPTGTRPVSASVPEMLEQEARWGVRRDAPYRAFAERAHASRELLRTEVQRLRASGKRIAAYGASAKGCVLLNFAALDGASVDFVVDRSPHKQGRFLPGTGVPIYAPEKLMEAMPDHVLLLVWNLADEVLSQQSEYRRRGGTFIVPMPEPRVVS